MKRLRLQAWNHSTKVMLTPSELSTMPTDYKAPDRSSETGTTYLLFTEYKDKDGEELFEDDVVRVKYGWGDEGYAVDSYFQVCIDFARGLTLLFLRASYSLPAKTNQIMGSSLTFERELDVDFRDQKFDRLAVRDTNGENKTFGDTWSETKYSNDIVKVGNIYQNPEYLS